MQSSLKSFFSRASSSGDKPSSGGPPEDGALQPPPTQKEGNTLEAELEKKRKYEQRALYKRSGGRLKNSVVGLRSRGLAGGYMSNRRYPGMQSRRKDWSAAEGVDICKYMNKLKDAGLSAGEFNRRLLQKMGGPSGSLQASCKRVRALHEVWKKGLAFWESRLEKVEVGKHGKRKVGQPLKNICRKSDSKGCRAAGGGRKDRFLAYKTAVKNCFTLELDNGQEVARRQVSSLTFTDIVCPFKTVVLERSGVRKGSQ